MMHTLLLVPMSLFMCYMISQAWQLIGNLRAARRTRIKYFIVPVFMQDIGWLFTQNLLVPLLDMLPPRFTEKWLPLLIFHRTWIQSYTPFRRAGVDTFVAVSPGRNVVWTCDPDVMTQVLGDRTLFDKPLAAFQVLNIFGPTIAGTGGEQWVRLKKITQPCLNEKTHRAVWDRSLHVADEMISSWGIESNGGRVPQIYLHTSRLALHVLVSVCFDHNLPWTGEAQSYGPVPPGHKLAFGEAFHGVLNRLREIYLSPPWLLKHSPLSMHRKAKEAYDEWLQYMNEMVEGKRATLKSGSLGNGSGLLETLLGANPKVNELGRLSNAEILGTIFVFILAGHETSGNTMSFCMLLLACRPDIQKKLQKELDTIFGPSDTEWSYKEHLPQLLNGYVGAIVRETLRLYGPVPFLLRETKEQPAEIRIQGEKVVIPPKTTIFVNATAAQRNPRFWDESDAGRAREATHKDEVREQAPFPISAFEPDRWLKPGLGQTNGAWLPFSDGPRVCIGQRFSMVEMVAAIARVFKEHSAELDIDDGEIDACQSQDERRKLWQTTKMRAENALSDGIKFVITLRMTKPVSLRFSKRGDERFFDVAG